MSYFSYLNENQRLYLEYIFDEDEIVNEVELKQFTEKKREGIVKTQFCQDERGKCIKYDVTSLITLKDLLTQEITDKDYCTILHSVATTFKLLEEEKISISSLVLYEGLIYYDTAIKAVKFISIPTNRFENEITVKQVLSEFSQFIISKMEGVNSLILEVNDYLMKREFRYAEFNCLINSIIMNFKENKKNQFTKREYDEQLEVKNSFLANNQLFSQATVLLNEEVLQHNLYKNSNKKNLNKKNLYKKTDSKERYINQHNNIDNNRNNRQDRFNNYNNQQNRLNNCNNQQNRVNNYNSQQLRLDSQDKENTSKNVMDYINMFKDVVSKNVKEITCREKKIYESKMDYIKKFICNLKSIKIIKEENKLKLVHGFHQNANNRQDNGEVGSNIDNSRVGNQQLGNSAGGTVIVDCMSGAVSDGNSISTSNPYLVRKSTGEKIYINANNFKLGRGKKDVDYYVDGVDTISKVHAYIGSNEKDFFIVDNSSKNHTYVNGKKIEPVVETVLKHMSKIRLAKEEFVFHLF